MDHPAKDWLFFKAAAADLPEYLLSRELYLPLVVKGGSRWDNAQEPLTVGNLLLSQFRLNAITQLAEQQLEFNRISNEISQLRSKWLTAWGKKVEQEALARLKLWGQYLGQVINNRTKSLPGYIYQVRQRVILDLLLNDMQISNVLVEEQIKIFDRNLHMLTSPGSFIWENELANGFSQDRFWYLYIAL